MKDKKGYRVLPSLARQQELLTPLLEVLVENSEEPAEQQRQTRFVRAHTEAIFVGLLTTLSSLPRERQFFV